jgi:hypothetical protein
MKKLGLGVAVLVLLPVVAAGIAAAASLPGAMDAGANGSGSPATVVAAAGKQRLTITDDAIFGQFGFCGDNGDVLPVSY